MISKSLSGFFMCALLTLSVSSVIAEESALVPQGKSISEFVSPDGRIDLDAVRRSGYQGALDLKGINVGIDPNTGEPLVQPSPTSASMVVPDDIYWDNSISQPLPGVNDTVYALTVFDTKLIVAGELTVAGDVFVNNIASWDGFSWSA